jgi:hypothetical protein
VSGATVTWSVETAQNNSPAMVSGWGSKKTGLTWGNVPESGTGGYTNVYQRLQEERIISATSNTSPATDASGKTTMQLTDIVGERVITVQAKVTIGGTDYYTVPQAVSFGNGPLAVFKAPVGTSSPYLTWDEAYAHSDCNNTSYPGTDHSAASGWSNGNYVGGAYSGGGVSTNVPSSGKMPTRAEYQAVSARDTSWGNTNPNLNAQGAACAAGWAAGWPNYWYWTGEAEKGNFACDVPLHDGSLGGSIVNTFYPVACRR